MCDHYGHLNVRYYAHLFDDSGFVLWPLCGVKVGDFDRLGVHTVVARTETDFKKELLAGQNIAIRSRWARIGQKSVSYQQQLLNADTEVVHAEQRVVEVFFNPKTRSSVPIPDEIRAALTASGSGS